MPDIPATEAVPRFSRGLGLAAVLLVLAGLALTVAGQRLLADDVVPARQYVDGRYWTIDPSSCAALGAESRGACVALDSAESARVEREHQNRVTVRAIGVVVLLSGTGLLVLAFVSSRRAAERLLR